MFFKYDYWIYSLGAINMSRKQFLKMTRQGQIKRIKREMIHSHAKSPINDNHPEEDVSSSEQKDEIKKMLQIRTNSGEHFVKSLQRTYRMKR